MYRLMTGLAILQKYNGDAEIAAEHDRIFVAIERDVVSKEDQTLLDSLGGWHWSTDADSWGFFT